MSSRREPLTQKQQDAITNLQPEFNDRKHELGVVSMARGDDPASAQTSFFICVGSAASLDHKYTVFARVVEGLAVIQAIEQAPRQGEEPVQRIEITRVQLTRAGDAPPPPR